jgi:hypothetical protein
MKVGKDEYGETSILKKAVLLGQPLRLYARTIFGGYDSTGPYPDHHCYILMWGKNEIMRVFEEDYFKNSLSEMFEFLVSEKINPLEVGGLKKLTETMNKRKQEILEQEIESIRKIMQKLSNQDANILKKHLAVKTLKIL